MADTASRDREALVGAGGRCLKSCQEPRHLVDLQQYQVQGVPHTVVNEKEHIYGMFSPQDFLDKLTKGQRDFGGMYA